MIIFLIYVKIWLNSVVQFKKKKKQLRQIENNIIKSIQG